MTLGHFSHISHVALTDTGRKRKNNEDAFGEFPSIGVFCVADGMGGGDDGEVASAAAVHAVELFAEKNPLPDDATYSIDDILAGIGRFVSNASRWIFNRTKERELKGCGSTFVGVCFDAANPSAAKAFHAGDSRLYRIRGKSISQITKDHSAAEVIGARDDDEVNPMFRGMVLRAVGTQPSVELEVTPFDVKEGDLVLICSDGLYRMVAEKKILSIVREAENLEQAVAGLVTAANESGGIDNITVVLLKVGKLPQPCSTVGMTLSLDESSLGQPGIQGEQDTGDTSSMPAATFYVDTETQATSAASLEGTSARTKSSLMIPEDTDPGELKDTSTATADLTRRSLFVLLRSFFVKDKKYRIYAIAILILIGVVMGVVLGVVRMHAADRAIDRARSLAQLDEARRLARGDGMDALNKVDQAKDASDCLDRLVEACSRDDFVDFMVKRLAERGKDDLCREIKRSLDKVRETSGTGRNRVERFEVAQDLFMHIREAMLLLAEDVKKRIESENEKLVGESSQDSVKVDMRRLDSLKAFVEAHSEFEDAYSDRDSNQNRQAMQSCEKLILLVADRLPDCFDN